MSKLYITEHRAQARSSDGQLMPMAGDEGIDQTPVDFSGGVVSSAAFAATTQYVRLATDAVCSVAFGATPTATANNRRLAANQTEYFGVVGTHKVSVIANT